MRNSHGAAAIAALTVAALVCAGGQAASASQTDAVSSGHLYVANGTVCCEGGPGPILRYPIARGRIAREPDLRFWGVGLPIATDSAGSLYARHGRTVEVFPLGSTTPQRIIALPFGAATAMTIDPNGFLYVAYLSSGGPRRPGPDNDYMGVWIYAPNANGNTKPIQHIRLGDFVNGLALDSSGNLFLSLELSWAVQVYANPTTAPALVRAITGGLRSPLGIAIVDGELYVLNNSPGNDYVTSYPDTASGGVKPDRTLLLPTKEGDGPGITAFGKHLFVPNWSTGPSAPHDVLIYRRDANGATKPVVFPVHSATPGDAKVGL